MKQRPAGFDPNTPDPKENRCHYCNHHGMNRTGLRAGVPWGSGTMTWVAFDCENNCDHGWIAPPLQERNRMKVDWDELKRLHELATPAPWRDDNGYRAYAGVDDQKWLFETKHSDANGFDSTFIVAMRNALPAILAERSAAENLYDKTATLYDYLLETDEEGLIHHATQMRDVWLAVNKYRNTDEAFDKETQND